MPPELREWLPDSVVWGVALFVLFAFISTRLAESKKAWADMLGPWGRRIARKARERRQREFSETYGDTPEFLALKKQIDILEGLVQTLDAKIKRLEAAEAIHAVNRDMTVAYLSDDAEWHVLATVAARERGLRLPPHKSYTQYCKNWRTERGLE